MTKTVFLLRHGKSDWGQSDCPDHDRPLNARGRQAAMGVGRWFKSRDTPLQLIVSSTALRAYSTAICVAREIDHDADRIVLKKNLYLAEPDAYCQQLAQLAQDVSVVLVVGHNPGMSELASRWLGQSIEMPTAGLVQVELALDEWGVLDHNTRGQLREVVRPREREA